MINSNHQYKRKLSTKYFGLVTVLTILMIPAYADQVVKATSGGTLNVGFSTDPANPTPGNQVQLKINFLKGSTIQQHIDYKVAVKEGDNQVCGTPLLHTAEGSISVPCQFQDAATYQVTIEVDGILFQPIPPETASFTLNVGNSNQSSTCGPISIPQWVKKNAGWWSQNSIDDSTFAQGIQYLIKQAIIKIPPTQSGQGTSSSQVIPQWVKKNAGWWSTGQIDDCTFVQGIQYMIQNGIIKV